MAYHGMYHGKECHLLEFLSTKSDYEMLQSQPAYIAEPTALTCGIQFCYAPGS